VVIELSMADHFHFVIGAYDQRPHSMIKHVHVTEWSTEPDKIQLLENYLRRRYERGEQLETLTVEKGSKKDIPLRLARRWMKEGLVRKVIRRTPSYDHTN
jgi:hypothetical protein